MTAFGWGFLLVTVYSLYIAYMVSRRMAGKNQVFLVLFTGLVVFCLNILCYGFTVSFTKNTVSLFAGDRYEATVVSFVAREGTTTPSGRTMRAPRKTTYYNAVVAYTDQHGNTVEREVNYGKSHPPVIGETIVISDKYDDDRVNDISSAQSLMVLAGFLFIAVLAMVSFFISCYGFGLDHKRNRKWSAAVFCAVSLAGMTIYLINVIVANS